MKTLRRGAIPPEVPVIAWLHHTWDKLLAWMTEQPDDEYSRVWRDWH